MRQAIDAQAPSELPRKTPVPLVNIRSSLHTCVMAIPLVSRSSHKDRPMGTPAYERAYTFFADMETTKRSFTLEQLREKTDYEPGTIDSYRTKKWFWFLVPLKRKGYFQCKGLFTETREYFLDLHRQKRGPGLSPSLHERVKVVHVHVPIVIDSRAWVVLAIVVVVRLRGY